MTRRGLEAWLLANGFARVRGRMTGHLQFERNGTKITVPGHGPQHLTKKHTALITRALVAAGFERAVIRALR